MTGDAVVGGLGAFDTDTIQPGYPRRPLVVDECPAGGAHTFEYRSAADQEDDSGRRFYDYWACSECNATPSQVDEGDAIQREIDRAEAYEAMVRP